MILGVSQCKVPIPLDEDERRRRRQQKSKKDALEIHKFLYKTQVVFPPSNIQQASTSQQFTLPAGEHTYDFSIVIPDNMACDKIKQPGSLSLSRWVIDSSGIDYAREAAAHMLGPLPPSLSDMGNTASVRYFLKATISRTSFYKMNIRVFKPIVYLPPDEDLNSQKAREIMFVRRNLLLCVDTQPPVPAEDLRNKGKGKSGGFMKTLFGSSNSNFPLISQNAATASITFEMRYPATASFVPVKPNLPFQLYAISTRNPEQFNQNGFMMVQDLIVKLFATTKTRAQIYSKEATQCLTLLEAHNLNIPLDWTKAKFVRNQQYGESWEMELPSALWEKTIIPDFVPPTFNMCNIQRYYAFEVIGGFSGTPGGPVQLVSLIPPITVMSGLSKKQQPSIPSRPGKSGAAPEGGDLPPPSYDTVVYQDEYGGDASAAVAAQASDKASAGPGAAPGTGSGSGAVSGSVSGAVSGAVPGYEDRRTFGQAPGYYENLEQFSTDTKS